MGNWVPDIVPQLTPARAQFLHDLAVGWPVYSALNAGANNVVMRGAAFMSIVIGLAILDLLINHVALRTTASIPTAYKAGAR